MKAPSRLLPWHEQVWKGLMDRARNGTLPHALLLTGPAGLGKELFAFQLAWSFLCPDAGENGLPCGQCRACSLMAASSHPDLLWLTRPPVGKDGKIADGDKRKIRVDHNADPFERTGKQVLVDQARALIEALDLTSQMGQGQVAVIAPADRLNWNAANALLKTLEEPNAGTLIILVATEPGRLPATVRSRCQRVEFVTPAHEVAQPWLDQVLGDASPEARKALLGLAGGAPLKAVTLHAEGALERHDKALQMFVQLLEGRRDPVDVGRDWARDPGPVEALSWLRQWCRDLIRARMGRETTGTVPGRLREAAQRVDLKQLFECFADIEEARRYTESNVNPGLTLIDLLSAWVPAKTAGVA